MTDDLREPTAATTVEQSHQEPLDPAAAAQQVEEVLEAERRTLSAECRAEPACLDSFLADDFHEFGASGSSITREGTAARVAATSSTAPLLQTEDLRGQQLADGLVMVKYTATIGTRRSHHTSLWRHTATSGWLMFHLQGTITTTRPETPAQPLRPA